MRMQKGMKRKHTNTTQMKKKATMMKRMGIGGPTAEKKISQAVNTVLIKILFASL